jgi:hypothetical protein
MPAECGSASRVRSIKHRQPSAALGQPSGSPGGKRADDPRARAWAQTGVRRADALVDQCGRIWKSKYQRSASRTSRVWARVRPPITPRTGARHALRRGSSRLGVSLPGRLSRPTCPTKRMHRARSRPFGVPLCQCACDGTAQCDEPDARFHLSASPSQRLSVRSGLSRGWPRSCTGIHHSRQTRRPVGGAEKEQQEDETEDGLSR